MEKCEGCGKEFDRAFMSMVEDKLYCLDCSAEPINKMFNKIKSIDIQRIPKKETKSEAPKSEKYIPCGLCRKNFIPWSQVSSNESALCAECKKAKEKLDEIRRNRE